MKRVIKHALITEKSSNLQTQGNQYVFVVDPAANKLQIREAVKGLKAGIDVEDIRTLVVRGKVKRLGRSIGKRSNFKKAFVRLKAGQTLELFEQV